jgi:hypothetical protein
MKREITKYLQGIENKRRREDSIVLVPLMEEASGYKAQIMGKNSGIGFGNYHYNYESGREGDSVVTAMSPRKQNLVVYIMPGFSKYQALLKKLGKHKTGSSCLYINKLDDVDISILLKIIERSCRDMEKKYACWA